MQDIIECRGLMLSAIADRFRQADKRALHRRSNVWSVEDAFIVAQVTTEPSTGLLEICWATPAMRMSIGLRHGDVRIGFIVAETGVPAALELKPEIERCIVVVRPCGDGRALTLVDFVFAEGLLASAELMARALDGDARDAARLADAIFIRAHHLRAGVASALREAAKKRLRKYEPDREEEKPSAMGMTTIEIESDLTEQEIARRAGVLPQYVMRADEDGPSGRPRYLVTVQAQLLMSVFNALANDSESLFVSV